jgi:hypothetical protein
VAEIGVRDAEDEFAGEALIMVESILFRSWMGLETNVEVQGEGEEKGYLQQSRSRG